MTIGGTLFYLYWLSENVISIVCADLSHHSLRFQWENNECAWLWGLVFYWVLCNNHTGQISELLLFRVYIFKCLLSPCFQSPLLTHCVFLSLFFPVSLVVLFPPFSGFTTSSFLSLPVFFSLSQSCRGSFTSTSTHTSNPTPTFISSRLSVSPAWLCAAATIPGARRWGHTPRESCRPDQISTIPTGHKTNSPAARLPPAHSIFFLSYVFGDLSVQYRSFFFPDTYDCRKVGFFLLSPLPFNLPSSTSSAPPLRVMFLHPLHQPLCPQCDLKSADSCQSFVCSPFRKLRSLWTQAMLDGFPGRFDSPSAYQLLLPLKLVECMMNIKVCIRCRYSRLISFSASKVLHMYAWWSGCSRVKRTSLPSQNGAAEGCNICSGRNS